MYDVIVVGAGPAGIAAAKRCSELGLKTVLLEREKLPRKKVCDGSMAPGAQALLKQEFGEIPDSVLSNPSRLSGLIFYVPSPVKFNYSTPWAWRSNLDYWMCQKAVEQGVELWQEAKYISLEEQEDRYIVRIRMGRKDEVLESKFVIGADGGASYVRRCLYPVKKFTCLYQAHERFETGPDLDKDWYHEFTQFDELKGLAGISAYFKDDQFVIGYGTEIKGQLTLLKQHAHKFLVENYGFDGEQDPVWSKNCIEPWFAGDLASGDFVPARENILLAGDAGGFMMPISMEGIGPGIRTGLLAAESIHEALETDADAEQIYLKKLKPMISLFGKAHEFEQQRQRSREIGDFDAVKELTASGEKQSFYNDY